MGIKFLRMSISINDIGKFWWYRLLKVVYVIAIFVALLFAGGIGYDAADRTVYSTVSQDYESVFNWSAFIETFLIVSAFFFLLAWLIRRIFFYIVCGDKFFGL